MTKRKKLLVMPLVVIPFLCMMFYSLGGGKGAPGLPKGAGQGFNTALPAAKFDQQKQAQTKLEYYRQADQDSLRRREYQRQDPNFQKMRDSIRRPAVSTEDRKADELMERLDKLKETIQQPAPPQVVERTTLVSPPHVRPVVDRKADTTEEDPQLEKLNTMLDKIIRIQHPMAAGEAAPGSEVKEPPVVPDIAAANSLPAVTQTNQVLVAGATIALRLTEEVKINGMDFPKDQLLYGVVSINNDRMLININSIRREQGLYPVALQVYDLDGLPGIHIPGSLGRETVKQSAEQNINSLGVVGLDPSPLGQVTNAGVMTARALLSRKVRQLRVTVKAGYQVLLRNTRGPGRVQVVGEAMSADSVLHVAEPPVFIPFLHRVVRHDKMELALQGIWLKDSLLWMVLKLENHSPMGYMPGYVRWCVRDRRQGRRTAFQEVPVKPLYMSPLPGVDGDSSRMLQVGFRPFSLPKDKVLVLLLAEGNGARELEMEIKEKELLKLRKYGEEEEK